MSRSVRMWPGVVCDVAGTLQVRPARSALPRTAAATAATARLCLGFLVRTRSLAAAQQIVDSAQLVSTSIAIKRTGDTGHPPLRCWTAGRWEQERAGVRGAGKGRGGEGMGSRGEGVSESVRAHLSYTHAVRNTSGATSGTQPPATGTQPPVHNHRCATIGAQPQAATLYLATRDT